MKWKYQLLSQNKAVVVKAKIHFCLRTQVCNHPVQLSDRPALILDVPV